MDNVVELLPRAEREEVEEMRQSLLKVTDEHHAMTRIGFLAERIADMLGEIDGVSVQDRISLQWHLSLIHELAVGQREQKLKPGCTLPRFPQRSEDRAREDRDRDRDHPDGAA
jgi:hypothetical protein